METAACAEGGRSWSVLMEEEEESFSFLFLDLVMGPATCLLITAPRYSKGWRAGNSWRGEDRTGVMETGGC
jgi:hypothetical protein